METAIGTPILDFDYDGDWYDVTNAQGYSLVIMDSAAATTTWSTKSSWRPSQAAGGNPGSGDFGVATGSVLINEVLSNTTLSFGDRIELYNTTAAAIDLSGWYLSDSSATLNKYRIPDGTTIAAGGYLSFNATTSFGVASGEQHGVRHQFGRR